MADSGKSSISKSIVNLPYGGEYISSPGRKYDEVVVFVHHFGGHKWSTKRHQEIVLNAGYDCVTFNLYYNSFNNSGGTFFRVVRMLFHLLTLRKDFVLQWTEELNDILNQLPGQKILYTLSSPSTSAIGCVGHNQRKDVRAWICDCGPFLDAWSCFRNYGLYQAKIKKPLILWGFTALGFLLFGGPRYEKRMRRWLHKMPDFFPVLSLRAAQDKLVPPSSIKKLFSLSNSLRIKSYEFSHAGHLSAVKSQPEEYQKIVFTFLQECQKSENHP